MKRLHFVFKYFKIQNKNALHKKEILENNNKVILSLIYI